MRALTIIVFMAFAACSCVNHTLGANEFFKWVEASKEIETKKEIGNYEFIAKYLPKQFLALREIRSKKASEAKIKEFEGNYSSSYTLILKIGAKDHQDILKEDAPTSQAIYAKLQYFLSGIQKDLSLSTGKDTLQCSICNFERTYNLNPYLTFYLVFDNGKNQEEHFDHDLTLIYHDRALGIGTVNIALAKKDLNDIPKIQIP